MKPKGRDVPPARIDHAAALRERLGKAAFEAATGSEDASDMSWETANLTSKEHYRRIGDAVRAAMIGLALWPAPPPARPRPPRSADVSAQVAYTTALEKYASALEQQLTGQGQ